jgi:hypothetical protein
MASEAASHLDLEPHAKHPVPLHAPSHAHGVHEVKTPSAAEESPRRRRVPDLEAPPRVAYFPSEKPVGDFDMERHPPVLGGEVRVAEGIRDDLADSEAGVFELMIRYAPREPFE